jgi:hypothetical protein
LYSETLDKLQTFQKVIAITGCIHLDTHNQHAPTLQEYPCATHTSPPAPEPLPVEVCTICDIAVSCDRAFGRLGNPPCAIEAAKAARQKVLDRLDKEIATRENEMNRKGNLEDNLTTATGYLTSAGALNWVRVVLINGMRESLRAQQEQPKEEP